MEPERGSSPIVPSAKTDACASPPPVITTAPNHPVKGKFGEVERVALGSFLFITFLFFFFPFFAFGTRRDTGRSFEISNPSHLMFSF